MLAKAMDYMLKRWGSFARFLDDGRICLTNNAAERALRGICLGRKSWLFAGSDRGGVRAAVMYTLIGTAKWTHPGKVEAPYTVCIASASNLTGLVKSSVECRRTGS